MKVLKIIICLLLSVSISGCNTVSQNGDENEVFWHESLRFYTKEEQQELVFNNVERFDELRTIIAQSEYSVIFVDQNWETGEYSWRISPSAETRKEDVDANIVTIVDSFLADFHCQSIICGSGEMRVKFWDELGISEIEYLENGPDPKAANFYTKLTGNWYYGEFPYDIVY